MGTLTAILFIIGLILITLIFFPFDISMTAAGSKLAAGIGRVLPLRLRRRGHYRHHQHLLGHMEKISEPTVIKIVDEERDQKLRELHGLIQIDMALRRPLPSHRSGALGCTSRRAIALGMKPLHPITHQLQCVAVLQQIGMNSR